MLRRGWFREEAGPACAYAYPYGGLGKLIPIFSSSGGGVPHEKDRPPLRSKEEGRENQINPSGKHKDKKIYLFFSVFFIIHIS